LTSVKNAITSWPTRDSISAIRATSKDALRIFGSASFGTRPSSAHASQASTSIRSQS